MPPVLATADIGSNTVHLLVGRVVTGGVQRVCNDSEWLSLGQVVSHEGEVPEALVRKLVRTIASFKAQAKAFKADKLYCFATEAIRRAGNHGDVMNAIEKETGVRVDMISPTREAELGLAGALCDRPKEGKFLFAESGGGSVQVAHCLGREILEESSLPIGTGVLIDQSELYEVAKEKQVELLESLVDKSIALLPPAYPETPVLACGGVARGLWRALHPDGDPVLWREELEYLTGVARRLDQSTICARFGVKPKRADTLLPGSIIYRKLLDYARVSHLTVSLYGVREGALLEMSEGRLEGFRL